MNKCEICDTPDDKKPMCFRNTKWCSELHRKMIAGEIPKDAGFSPEVKEILQKPGPFSLPELEKTLAEINQKV